MVEYNWLDALICCGAPLHKDYGFYLDREEFALPQLLFEFDLVSSISEGFRQLKQNAISINGTRTPDKRRLLTRDDIKVQGAQEILDDHRFSFGLFLSAMNIQPIDLGQIGTITLSRGKAKHFILCYGLQEEPDYQVQTRDD